MLDALPVERWQTITWREAAGTVLHKQFVAVRVPWVTGGAGLYQPSSRLHGTRRAGFSASARCRGEHGEGKWYPTFRTTHV